jgi:hypothetical protein
MDYKKLTVDELKYIIENIDGIREKVRNAELAHNPECYKIQGLGYMSIIKVNKLIDDHVHCEVIEFDTSDNDLYCFKDVAYHISMLTTATPVSYEEFKQISAAVKVALENIENEKKRVWELLVSTT